MTKRLELVEREKLRKLLFHFAFYNNKELFKRNVLGNEDSREFNSKGFTFIFIIFIHCDIHYDVNRTFPYFSHILILFYNSLFSRYPQL